MTHTRSSILKIIEAYERETLKWHERGKRIEKRYRDEDRIIEGMRRYNVLWSNTETLKPFLYSSTPKPIVSQRGDTENQIARIAAEVLERALVFTVAEEHFGTSLRNARDDYLLPGRGTVWARYVPEFKPAEVQVSENNSDDQPELGDTLEVVAFESAVVDYVHWRDFGHELARTWEEVDVVWRRVGLNREALEERFTKGAEVPLDAKQDDRLDATKDRPDKAVIYEVWIKSEKRAVWLSKSFKELLDDLPDPLKLDHFFPCPRPAYATLTTNSLIPVPDYVEYQDQADELDDLTGRIANLTAAIKAVGVYDSSVPALQEILNDGRDNQLIPVTNWAALSEKGGIKSSIELLPMQEIAQTLLSLYEAREKVKADLYEVTGMSDIIRGNTAPEETATAQQIKSNFATKRLEERQREVERFARNAVDLLGNIIAVHFAPETLIAMTGMKLLPNQQAKMQAQFALGQGQVPPAAQYQLQDALQKPTWEEVIALLRDQPRRRFSIDIETDSIVAPDDAQQQQQRTQFIQGITQFLETAGQIASADPSAVPLMGELLKFGAGAFRVGRDLMDCIDEYVDLKVKQANQPQPPKPDPAMAKVQADAQLGQQKLQFQAQSDQAEQAAEAQRHAAQMQQTAQLEVLKAHLDQQAQAQQAAFNARLDQQQAAMTAMTEHFKAMLQARTQIEVAEISAGATLDAAQISAANQGSEE
jgi:hypothetical protein